MSCIRLFMYNVTCTHFSEIKNYLSIYLWERPGGGASSRPATLQLVPNWRGEMMYVGYHAINITVYTLSSSSYLPLFFFVSTYVYFSAETSVMNLPMPVTVA